MNTNTGLGLVLLGAIAIASNGCTATSHSFEWEADDSNARLAQVVLNKPVKVGVLTYSGQNASLHNKVVSFMEGLGNFEEVVRNYRPDRQDAPEVDYVVDLRPNSSSEGGKLINFVTCFPGFVFFMPNWFKLRWDYRIETEVGVEDTLGRRIDSKRIDVFEAAFTSATYATMSHAGWWTILLYPMAAFPFGAGIVSVFDSPDLFRMEGPFINSQEGYAYALSVANMISASIKEAQDEPADASQSATKAPLSLEVGSSQ